MQVPRLFADFFAREPFGVQKRLLTFWHLFGVFLTSFWRTKKVRDFLPSFSRKKDGKKLPRQFGRQKVVWKKDGKRSWHLRS